MIEILNLIKQNSIDYDTVLGNAIVSMFYDKNCDYDIHVVVPARGRPDFVKTLLPSLQKAEEGFHNVSITLVEHAPALQHKEMCEDNNVNYVGIIAPGVFNKCLAFNAGAILGNRAKWLVCHDLDCLVQYGFYTKVLMNVSRHKTLAVQSYYNRSPVYCNTILTSQLIKGEIDVNSLSSHSPNVFMARGEAPGGSITIERDFFFEIGGYDPELFTGYSPEDKFFWDKMAKYVNVGTCYSPVVNVFHMDHPPSYNTNPLLQKMIAIEKQFLSLSPLRQEEIIRYKADLISKYK